MRIKKLLEKSIFFFVLISAPVFAFELIQEGVNLRWQMPMQVVLNPDNCTLDADEMEEQISRAIKVWNDVEGVSIDISYSGRSTLDYEGYLSASEVSQVHIFCDNKFYDHELDVSAAATTLAVGAPGSNSGGRVKAGYLAINVQPGMSNSEYEAPHLLGPLIAHELGHVLGLGHTDVRNSLMNTTLNQNITLSADDLEGIRALYPAKSSPGDLFACEKRAQAQGAALAKSAVSFDLFFLVAALWIFKIRRKKLNQ